MGTRRRPGALSVGEGPALVGFAVPEASHVPGTHSWVVFLCHRARSHRGVMDVPGGPPQVLVVWGPALLQGVIWGPKVYERGLGHIQLGLSWGCWPRGTAVGSAAEQRRARAHPAAGMAMARGGHGAGNAATEPGDEPRALSPARAGCGRPVGLSVTRRDYE